MKYKKKLIFATAIFIFAFILLAFSSDIAYAALPDSYISSVTDMNLDWWTGENGLDLTALKKTVKGWFSDGSYDFEYLKRNPVTVAVIDSGINLEHELFKGNYDENGLLSEEGDFGVLLKDAHGDLIYKNTVTKGSTSYSATDIADDAENKHGTHVAGIIAILIHELGLEEYIKILPIKASYQKREFANGRWEWRTNFNVYDVQAAIAYAIENGADVVNMSLAAGGDAGYSVSDDQADKAVFVAAAGNAGKNSDVSNSYKYYPAADSNVIGVMNYAYNDGKCELYSRSNYGSSYDLCAPGVDIYSADGAGENIYQSLDGTSMSSPIVAFGAALLIAKNRAVAGENGGKPSARDVKNEVINAYSSTVTRKGDARGFNVFDINKLIGKDEYYGRIEVIEGDLEQYLGSIQPLRLRFVGTPSAAQGDVKWFVDGVQIGVGYQLSYTPIHVAGTTEISAVWKPLSQDREITCSVNIIVNYIALDADAIKAFTVTVKTDDGNVVHADECKTGEEYRLSLTGIENVSPDETINFMWYINDEYYANGEECAFVPEDAAEYEVKVKINGIFSQERTLVAVRDTERRQGQVLKIVSIAVGAAIFVTIACIVIIIAVKSQRAKSDNN